MPNIIFLDQKDTAFSTLSKNNYSNINTKNGEEDEEMKENDDQGELEQKLSLATS